MRFTQLRAAARMPVKGWTIAATILVLALASVPVALGKDGDVIRRGPCTAASDWRLKLSPENGQIEVEFEVDQNKVGDTWRVVMRRNGVIFFQGNRVTKAPSGSFEVRRVISNPAGSDTIVARAVNLSTDEVCRGSATATF
jgi:hypothetical protein